MRMRHQPYNPKHGYSEVEGTAEELAIHMHELEKLRALNERKIIDLMVVKEKPTDSELLRMTDDILKLKIKSLTLKKIVEYIYSLDRANMNHTMKELTMHFLGQALYVSSQRYEYRSFYAKMQKAHTYIETEKNGRWESSWENDKEGRNARYKFNYIQ